MHLGEAVNERSRDRPGWRGNLAERVRRLIDLEHWAAFRASFRRLGDLLEDIAQGRYGDSAPRTISVMSGDVHHSYVARVAFDEPVQSAVWQLTCSPVHNVVPAPVRLAFRLAWSRAATSAVAAWGRRRGLRPAPVNWNRVAGPVFRNQVAVITIAGSDVSVDFQSAIPGAATWSVDLGG